MKVINTGTVRPFEATILVKVRGEGNDAGSLTVLYKDVEVVGGTVYDTDPPAGALKFAEDAVKGLIQRGAGL